MRLRWSCIALLAFGVAIGACSIASDSAGAVAPAADAGAESAAAADATDDCKPVAAASETVRVTNDIGALEGTLDVPDGCEGMPVAVILSGSGTTDRDGNQGPGNQPSLYRMLAEAVRDAGFAVLRYDDPGIGKSVTAVPKKVEDFRYEMEVDDAALFIAALRKDSRFGPVVATGHSQGSLTGILVAAKQPIDGFVSLAGAGRPAGEILHEQLAPKLDEATLAKLDDALAKLSKGELAGPLPAPLDQILPLDTQPYIISWMKYDPKVEIAKLAVPALLLQGKLDIQVSVEDATLLHEGKPDAKLVLVDDMGHMLRKTTGKTASSQADTYSKPLPIHATVRDEIAGFIGGLVKK